MSPGRLRLVLPGLVATAGLACAGCGGSGGDEAAYVKTYEGACKAITTTVAGFTTSVGPTIARAPKDPDGAVAALKDGVTKVFDTFGAQIRVMADADAPKRWRAFQDSVADGADGAEKGIAQAKGALGEVRTVADFTKLGAAFQKIDIGRSTENMPADLAAKAPSCRTLGGGTSAF